MKKVYPVSYDRLEETILLSGHTYSSIGRICGKSRQYIHTIFKRKSAVAPKIAKAICETCNKKFNELFFIKDVYKSGTSEE